jgi:hypothetical protein
MEMTDREAILAALNMMREAKLAELQEIDDRIGRFEAGEVAFSAPAKKADKTKQPRKPRRTKAQIAADNLAAATGRVLAPEAYSIAGEKTP